MAGHTTRLLVRDPARTPRVEHSEVAVCAYADAAGARRALDDINTVFMVSASESADRLDEHRTFVDAAADAGVRHIVYTSFQGAAPDATFTLARDHWATEQHVERSAMAWTFLRDSFYLDLLPLFAGEDGVIRGPAGEGRVAAVARHRPHGHLPRRDAGGGLRIAVRVARSAMAVRRVGQYVHRDRLRRGRRRHR
ncbi:NAD(P)H-binding protein [Aeromicrobium sp. PE09-221]|uniref:NAD(P)H-binding protein n=1 Tax=Aeromicrobium sp. PE09-221 TaxID=1898043 RepID=UPI001F2868E4|nr:NAD(P)H-binding protein [Aeromicrobium sp. PE09-221]